VPTTKKDVQEYVSKLPPQSKVALEATNNWYTFVEWTNEYPLDIVLAHPSQLKAIATARVKTDNIDSKIIADLLRTDFIPKSYIAPKEVRDTRELVRYRTALVRARQQFLVKIHSVLFKNGESIPGNTFTSKKGQKRLQELPIRSIYKLEILSCLIMYEEITKQIEIFEMQIRNQANADENTKLLMTIPGISFYSALLIMSEIGDYKRFSSSRKLCRFAGLVPSVYASGGKIRRGRITKQGSVNMHFVLLQAVTHVTRKSPYLKRLYDRIKRKHGGNTARIAVARKLLCVMLVMLRQRRAFNADY
jgi:transposase